LQNEKAKKKQGEVFLKFLNLGVDEILNQCYIGGLIIHILLQEKRGKY